VRWLRWAPGNGVVHTCGAESLRVLAPPATEGAQTACLHPLQTFAADRAQGVLQCVTFALEAEGLLRTALLAIVDDLGGRAVDVKPEDRPLYHASAVLVSNYVVTLAKL